MVGHRAQYGTLIWRRTNRPQPGSTYCTQHQKCGDYGDEAPTTLVLHREVEADGTAILQFQLKTGAWVHDDGLPLASIRAYELQQQGPLASHVLQRVLDPGGLLRVIGAILGTASPRSPLETCRNPPRANLSHSWARNRPPGSQWIVQ